MHESLCLSVFREGSTFHQAWIYRPLSHPRCPHSLCITPYPFPPNPHSLSLFITRESISEFPPESRAGSTGQQVGRRPQGLWRLNYLEGKIMGCHGVLHPEVRGPAPKSWSLPDFLS